MTRECRLCPFECRSQRLDGQLGHCKIPGLLRYSHAIAHFGEEPPVTGKNGSGTVFLSGCNARCFFCQNFQISQESQGKTISTREMASLFIKLQDQGCQNINWVSPTPHLFFLVEALSIAVDNGLTVPLVYNTNGYMSINTLKLLDGIVDIYLPDMKYGEDLWAETYSELPFYSEYNRRSVQEMVRQTGVLQISEEGTAQRGVLVRHLVLPEGVSGYRKIFRWLAEFNAEIPVSIMGQYQPCFHAQNHPVLGRALTCGEYEDAVSAFHDSGLYNGFIQNMNDLRKKDGYFPDFTQNDPNVFDPS